MNDNRTEILRDLLQDFSTAVLLSHTDPDWWHARPMAIARVEENGDLWFITNVQSAKVREIEADTRVQVICQNGWSSCAVVTGHAGLVRDREMIREMWQPAFKIWFPGGVEDPDIVLIRVAGERGEYWDNTGVNRLIYIYESLKAIVKGTTPEISEGRQHGVVTLSPVSSQVASQEDIGNPGVPQRPTQATPLNPIE